MIIRMSVLEIAEEYDDFVKVIVLPEHTHRHAEEREGLIGRPCSTTTGLIIRKDNVLPSSRPFRDCDIHNTLTDTLAFFLPEDNDLALQATVDMAMDSHAVIPEIRDIHKSKPSDGTDYPQWKARPEMVNKPHGYLVYQGICYDTTDIEGVMRGPYNLSVAKAMAIRAQMSHMSQTAHVSSKAQSDEMFREAS